jgi:hypothetical protein
MRRERERRERERERMEHMWNECSEMRERGREMNEEKC